MLLTNIKVPFIVSHDREFIDNTCNSVWAFEGDGKIADIIGGYSDYEAYAAYLVEQEKQQQQQTKQEKPVVQNQINQKKSNKLSYKLKLELEVQ